MSYLDDTPTHDPPPPEQGLLRPRYRVPVGIPQRDEGRRAGVVISILIHALVIGLLIIPLFMPGSVIERMQQGAGGAGPAGGGGGGSRGRGGDDTRERVQFVKVSPVAVPTPRSLPPVPAPVQPKVVPLPPVVTPKATVPTPAPAQSALPAPSVVVASVVPGVGGGTGTDGTAGNGPGSGGGVGSGVGTGKGSANGPGTGGGNQANYPPMPIALSLPPMPAPSSVHGFKFIAEFDVDSTGRVLDVKFTPTPDGDYNRRLAAVLHATRFRPGTRPDGTPLRMKAQIGWDF